MITTLLQLAAAIEELKKKHDDPYSSFTVHVGYKNETSYQAWSNKLNIHVNAITPDQLVQAFDDAHLGTKKDDLLLVETPQVDKDVTGWDIAPADYVDTGLNEIQPDPMEYPDDLNPGVVNTPDPTPNVSLEPKVMSPEDAYLMRNDPQERRVPYLDPNYLDKASDSIGEGYSPYMGSRDY